MRKKRFSYNINICGCLDKYGDVEEAIKWFEHANRELADDEFVSLVNETLTGKWLNDEVFSDVLRLRNKKDNGLSVYRYLEELFCKDDYETAESFYQSNKEYLSKDNYEKLKQHYENQQHREIAESYKKELGILLRQYKFAEADKLFSEKNKYLDKNWYEGQKQHEEQRRQQRLEQQRLEQQRLKEQRLKEQRLEQQRLEQQRLKEQRKQRRQQLEPIIQLAKQALRIQPEVHILTPYLNTQDIQLALKWYQGPNQILQEFNESGFDKSFLISNYAKDWELGRVLSARAAEKVVMEFYQHYGLRVEDVSIHQVTSDENYDWKSHDLKINDYPFDVKNSRRSRQSPDNYVEHCVPSFKQDRATQDVIIAGVLSPYLWGSGILDPESTDRDTLVIFLGVTKAKKLIDIKNEFEDPNLLQIYLGRPGRRGDFLPAWMFDYPQFVYKQRDDAICQMAQQTIPEGHLWIEFNLAPPIPLSIAAGMNLSEIQKLETFTNWERSFLSDILNRHRRYGLSLPFLFLGILKHFLQMVSNSLDENKNYRPDRYRRFIYSPEHDPDSYMPLGIYDSLKTIDSLITSLDTLWDAEHGLIRRYRVFQLQGLNILRGRPEANDKWKTLIAYCGGRLSDNTKCGKNPLVLGDCSHCPECDKLICPDCDFCSEMCKLYQTRKQANSDNSVVDGKIPATR